MSKQFHSKIAGVSMRNEDGELRQDIIRDFVEVDDMLTLERQPRNRKDRNAIAVFTEGANQVGFLNGEVAAELAPLMDSGQLVTCKVTNVTGGDEGKTYGVNVLLVIYTLDESRKIKAERKQRKPDPVYAESAQQPIPEQPKIIDPNKSPRSIAVLLLLWLLLGYIGGHRWYAGRGSFLYTITIGYVMIGWIIDLFVILAEKFEDNHGKVFKF